MNTSNCVWCLIERNIIGKNWKNTLKRRKYGQEHYVPTIFQLSHTQRKLVWSSGKCSGHPETTRRAWACFNCETCEPCCVLSNFSWWLGFIGMVRYFQDFRGNESALQIWKVAAGSSPQQIFLRSNHTVCVNSRSRPGSALLTEMSHWRSQHWRLKYTRLKKLCEHLAIAQTVVIIRFHLTATLRRS